MSKMLMVFSMGMSVLALMSCTCAKGMFSNRLQITQDGGANYTIVTGSSPSEAEKNAANELATHLEKITGAQFKAVSEKDFSEKTRAIYLGWTEYSKVHGIDGAALDKEEWVVKTVDGNLIISGGRPRGVLYGVYEFLEKYCGCAWLDEHVSIIPKTPSLTIPAIDEQAKPAFWAREVYTGFFSKGLQFQVRNKCNSHSWSAQYGWTEAYGSPGGGHTFYAYSKDWPKEHPEYFSLNEKGERLRAGSGAGPGQICLTNPEVRKLVLQQLKTYIKEDREKAAKKGSPPPRLYDISHNDDMAYCVCPGCKAVLEREGAYSGVLLDFINEVARGIKDEHPDVIIQTFAYTFTLDPPKHIRPENNVMVQVCDLGSEWYPITKSENLRSVLHNDNKHFQDNVKDWAKIARRISVWDYWKLYKGGDCFPYSNVRHLQPDLKFFADNHVEKVFAECEDPDRLSFSALKQWLGYKLMDNPNRPAEPLIKLFMDGYYGVAAAPMTEYLTYMEDRIDSTEQYFGRENTRKWKYYDREFFIRVNDLLDKAEKLAADNPTHLNNVRRERMPVDLAMLHMWEKVEKENWPFKKADILTRYEQNRKAAIKEFYRGDDLKKAMDELSSELRLLKEMPIPVPEQFKGKEIVDFLWPDFHRRIIDPEATAGQAFWLGEKPVEGNTPDHTKPMTIGVYDVTNKKSGPSITIKKEDIPQDGKYHWYKVGAYPISQRTYVWTGYWLIQIYLNKAYQPPAVKTMEIHVSMKVKGPAYVKGSKEENRILIDRVILVDVEKSGKGAE